MIQNKIIQLKHKITFILVLFLSICNSPGIIAQNVGINNTGAPPDQSAIVDMASTTSGFLIPRMTHAEMVAIAAPATSLMVYSTTDLCFYFYTGAAWQALHCTCLGAPIMSITGNATPCQGSTQTYTASLISGSPATSYVWTFPAGTIINSGQGTAVVNVTWGSTSGNITLVASNNCGTGGGTLSITVTPVLTSATPITGPTALQVCANGNNYSVPVVAGAITYTWSIKPIIAGTVCTSGQGTNAISVDFGATAATYTITVYDSNACGISSPPTQLIVTTTVNHGTLSETVPGHYSWVVPCGITSITITMNGARGGRGHHGGNSGNGGKGAKIVATLAVVSGTLYDLYVGQEGGNGASNTAGGAGGTGGNAGDENGGNGYGDPNTATYGSGGGGGASSSIRTGGTTLADRIFVAGGGGGAGREDDAGENGGAGGNVGANGAGAPAGERGLGGTAIAGGLAVLYSPGLCAPVGVTSVAGALGLGGNGGMTTASTTNSTCHYGGGGGGGAGSYGGSGGCAGGGGGGSSYVDPAATGVTVTNGSNAGNGNISIVY